MEKVDVAVIGSGPSGREAAVAAAAAGRKVVVVEQEATVGGACVKFGTIPSKALRETAATLARVARFGSACGVASFSSEAKLAVLRGHLDEVLHRYEEKERALLDRAGIDVWHGRASFVSPRELLVRGLRGTTRHVTADIVVVASGSRPRLPEGIDVDHEAIVDSDSLLSFSYLPESLVVLGGGVIASEYASIFASLGVRVTMIDRAERPLGFLDRELSAAFVEAFRAASGTYLGGRRPLSATATDLGGRVVLDDGTAIEADRVLVALGRVANVEQLDLARAGLVVNARGFVPVGRHGESAVPGVYVVGDAAGPPSLAASGVEQGRRAILHALGMTAHAELGLIPTGVYTIPEIGAVGLTEEEARAQHGHVVISKVDLARTARGLIGSIDGFFKMIADARGDRILGVHAVGEGATELVSVGQVAMASGLSVAEVGRCVFNFPTLGEAYRIAAGEIVERAQRDGAIEQAARVVATLAPPSRARRSVHPVKNDTPNVIPG
jgi:NAD(P) transhydrogenase